LRLKVIVAVTEWKTVFTDNPWHVPIRPSPVNGLSKDSAADALQAKINKRLGFFGHKLGVVSIYDPAAVE
jgi:hypothetical protein